MSLNMASCLTCSACVSDGKNHVTVRNKAAEYSALYSMACDLLQTEHRVVVPSEIHMKLDSIICQPCSRILRKYSTAINAIEPIKKRLKDVLMMDDSQAMVSLLACWAFIE